MTKENFRTWILIATFTTTGLNYVNSLIERIKTGDREAFKTLFDREYANLVRFSYGYLYDQKASEDLVQDAFIFVWENADKIHIRASFKSYLYTLVKNRSLNVLKSIDVREIRNIYELELELSEEENLSEPETDVEGVNLWRVVDALPEKMQRIVELRFVQNYKYNEIAEELNLSVNTVKTQLKRAKLKIGEHLQVGAVSALSQFGSGAMIKRVSRCNESEYPSGMALYAIVPPTQGYIPAKLILDLPKGVSASGKWEKPGSFPSYGVYLYSGELLFNQYLNMENPLPDDT